jgi:dihydrolipoamide dehydrogenase
MADKDVIVIGSGPAGHAAALRAAELGASVAVVEAGPCGGNCVNFGCIPNNVMLETVRLGIDLQEFALAGVIDSGNSLNFSRAVARKDRLVAGMADGIRNQFDARAIDFISGHARLISPNSISVNLSEGGSLELSSRAIVIATGARPEPPSLPGFGGEVLTMDQALRLAEPPISALVLGGGPVGLGFALEQAFVLASFGSVVTVVEPGDDPLPGADPEMVEYLLQGLSAAGVRVLVSSRVSEISSEGTGREAVLVTADQTQRVPAATIIAPDCRRTYFDGLGLDQAGVENAAGGINVDDRCATNVPGIFAVGDVTGVLMFSHAAALQGRAAAENALGLGSRARLRALPRAVHTEPEMAYVGLNEQQARDKGYEVRIGLSDLSGNFRAVARGQREGAVKLIVGARHGEILGVHILGPGAAELIGQAALALQLDNTVEELADITHWHPSLAEALVDAARRVSQKQMPSRK